MDKKFLKRLCLFLIGLAGCALFAIFLIYGTGSLYSPHAYIIIFAIFLPILILAGVFYLFSSLVKSAKAIAVIRVSSLVGGLIGPAYLFYGVYHSADGEAPTALVGTLVVYCLASMLIFIALTLLQWIRTKLN